MPLKNEISRLTAENNHLHQDIIKLADERESKERETQQTTRKLESRTSDLRFMATQYSKRIELEQKRADEARDRAEQVMSKLGLFQQMKSSDASSLNADKMFARLQKIDVETGLEPLQQTPSYFTPPDPAIADMLRLAQGRIEQLEESKKNFELLESDFQNESSLLREQIAKRDMEIKRLGAQLEVSRSQQFGAYQPTTHPNTFSVDTQGQLTKPSGGATNITAARERIEQLEIQVEYLQDHSDALERELGQFESLKKEEISAYKNARDKMSEDLKLEKERSDGLLKNLTKLQQLVNNLDEFKGPDKQQLKQQLTDVHKKLVETEHKLSEAQLKLKKQKSTKPGVDSSDEVSKLQERIKDLEALNWTCQNDLKEIQTQLESETKLAQVGETFKAKVQVLTSELQGKADQILALSNQIQELQNVARLVRILFF